MGTFTIRPGSEYFGGGGEGSNWQSPEEAMGTVDEEPEIRQERGWDIDWVAFKGLLH